MHVFTDRVVCPKLDSHAFSLPLFTYPVFCFHLIPPFSCMSSEFSISGPSNSPELQTLDGHCHCYLDLMGHHILDISSHQSPRLVALFFPPDISVALTERVTMRLKPKSSWKAFYALLYILWPACAPDARGPEPMTGKEIIYILWKILYIIWNIISDREYYRGYEIL